MSNEDDKKNENPPVIAIVAFCGAFASVVIALIAFVNMQQISDVGMIGIAIMVAAPSAMAFGISYALIKYGKPQ